jgi:cystathionine beta-lyase family protein involved in aluminum resistance
MDTIETIIGIVRSQQEKGLKKYGVTVDDANLTTIQWIDHICEEKVDELIYLQKLKQSLLAVS